MAEEEPKSPVSSSVSIINREKSVEITWNINNFSDFQTLGAQIVSSVFSFSEFLNNKCECKFVCSPYSKPESSPKVIFYLYSSICMSVQFTVKIMINQGGYAYELKGFKDLNRKKIIELAVYDRKTLLDPKNMLLTDNALKISFRLRYSSNTGHQLLSKMEIFKNEVISDVEKLFNDDSMSDIVIVVGDKKIPAHKCILFSRCPVFKAMFNSDMKESKENCIKINNFSYEVIFEILNFIYSGTSPKVKEIADRLIEAAHFYGLDSLTVLCELEMVENVSLENFCSFLELAERLKLNVLKDVCRNFMLAYFSDILKVPGFDEFMQSSPDIVKEMCTFYAEIKEI